VARHLTVQACQRWRLDVLAERAELVASELVANAVEHARSPFEFALNWLSPQLHMAVRDGSQEQPRLGGGAAGRGRGLTLVDAFTTAWGSAPAPGGKVVWATMTKPGIGAGFSGYLAG
jgi:hypothetical protein